MGVGPESLVPQLPYDIVPSTEHGDSVPSSFPDNKGDEAVAGSGASRWSSESGSEPLKASSSFQGVPQIGDDIPHGNSSWRMSYPPRFYREKYIQMEHQHDTPPSRRGQLEELEDPEEREEREEHEAYEEPSQHEEYKRKVLPVRAFLATRRVRPASAHLWTWVAGANLLLQIAVLVSSIYLYRYPRLYPLSDTEYIFRVGLVRLTTKSFNALMIFSTALLAAISLGIFSRIVYFWLVYRLEHRGMSMDHFESWLAIGGARIKWRTIVGFILSLPGFVLFTAYTTALSASYTLNNVRVSSDFSLVAVNITENIPQFVSAGYLDGDIHQLSVENYEASLSSLGYVWNTVGFLLGYSLTPINGVNVLSTNGMVLGAELPSTITVRLSFGAIPATAQEKRLITNQIGSNAYSFNATGVCANATCAAPAQPLQWTSQIVGGSHFLGTVGNAACGNTSRTYAIPNGPGQLIYDVLSCNTSSSISTTVFAIDSTGALSDSITCDTTLYDTFGTAVYYEATSSYTADESFSSSLMPPLAVSLVEAWTNSGWIGNLGRSGSEGLFRILNGTSMTSPSSITKLQYAIPFLYSVGGAKLINAASVNSKQAELGQSVLAAPWTVQNTTVAVSTAAEQMGMDRSSVPWLTVIVFHVAVALWMVMLAWWCPNTGVDPSLPTTLHLYMDENAGEIIAIPAKPAAEAMKVRLKYL